jgi:hypothetical protein
VVICHKRQINNTLRQSLELRRPDEGDKMACQRSDGDMMSR